MQSCRHALYNKNSWINQIYSFFVMIIVFVVCVSKFGAPVQNYVKSSFQTVSINSHFFFMWALCIQYKDMEDKFLQLTSCVSSLNSNSKCKSWYVISSSIYLAWTPLYFPEELNFYCRQIICHDTKYSKPYDIGTMYRHTTLYRHKHNCVTL